jgi:peptidoglycan hydrolase-like protein with peptidoglycan-binding domain
MISKDDGRTFVPTNGGYSGRFANAILADREKPGRIYATTINTATGGGFFFVSDDDGATWQPSMRSWPKNLIGYSMLQDEKDGNVIYLGTNYGVYRSIDRGASWSPIGAPKAEPVVKRRRGRRGRGGTSARGDLRRGGARRADSPAIVATPTTSPRSNTGTIKRAQEALNAAGYNVGTPDGVAGTRTVAAIRKFQADKSVPVSGALDSATLGALGLGDGGATSTAAGGAPSVTLAALSDSVNSLAYAYDERNGRTGIFAATNVGLFRTYDPAQGWEKLSFGNGLDSRTTSISTSAQNPKMIYAGTVVSGVIVSRDGGATWQQVEGIPANAPISSIKQDNQRSAFIYVGTRQTLYVSHDGGEKWMRRGGNLPIGDYTSILINPQNSDEIFVGNAFDLNGGVYRSVDAGINWQRIDSRDGRLPSQRIWSLAFNSGGQSKLFVGSHSAGIYVVDRGAGAQASAGSK